MVEELLAIKNWLKKQESDDPIAEHKKNRVYTQIARRIRANPAAPKGRCHICGGYFERVLPKILRICRTCYNKLSRNGNTITIHKTEYVDNNCDYCLGRAFIAITINPFMCQKCSMKLGKVHTNGIFDMRKERAKIEARKPWKQLR